MGRVPEPDQRDVSATDNTILVEPRHPSGPLEVNMEVPVTADEVMRAGGFGATDDIGTVLPAACDCTDFEGHLRDARGYEGSMDKTDEGLSDSPNMNLEAGKANIKVTDKVGEAVGVTPEAQDSYEAVNMETSFFSNDVMRAGGFGATDNISSFLPVASDYTDFEENLRDARGYEESEEKSSRPGLGWRSE